MPGVIKSSLDIILPLIQQRIMSVTGWGIERVILDTQKDAEENEEKFQAEQVIFIRSEFPDPTGAFQGDGSVWPSEDVMIVCPLWTRDALDSPPGFQSGLSDPVLGHDTWRLAIQNALYGFAPTDSSNNWLVQQPIQPGVAKAARRVTRPENADFSWARSEVVGILTYAPAINIHGPVPPVPPPSPPAPPAPVATSDTCCFS